MNRTILTVGLCLILASCGGGGGSSAIAPVAVAPTSPAPVVDDTASLQALIDKGGVVQLEARTYHLSRTLLLRRSGTVLVGAGLHTVLEYTATTPPASQHCVNDRVMTTPCDFDDTPPRRVAADISVGAISFAATQASDVADLTPGTWVIISDYDSKIGDRVAVDWAQVVSVDGLTVYVTVPFRTAFTTARPWVPGKSGLGFEPVPAVANLELRNFAVVVNGAYGGVCLFGALNATIDHVTVTDHGAQPFYDYIGKGLTLTNSTANGGGIISEIAATVNINISGNTFSADGPGLALDLGAAYFTIADNTVAHSGNAGVYLAYGVHDGSFSDNQIGYVDSSTPGYDTDGLLVLGSWNITVSGNYFAGGAGSDSIGVNVEGYGGGVLPLPATNVTVAGNTFGSWTMPVRIAE